MFKTFEINSRQNPRYKSWLKALEGRGIRKTGEAILAGRKFGAEVLTHFPDRVSGVVVQSQSMATEFAQLAQQQAAQHTQYELPPEFLKEHQADQAEGHLEASFHAHAQAFSCTWPLYILPPDMFAELDIYGTSAPLLIIKAIEPPQWNGELAEGLTLFLPFQNPINLGTTIRSAAALGAEVVILCEAVNLYHPKTLRAAGPALFKASLQQGPDLTELAQLAAQTHLPLYALALKGDNLFSFDFPATMGLVAGREGPGLEDIWPQQKRLSIPMQPGVESLNAAAAMDMALAVALASRYN